MARERTLSERRPVSARALAIASAAGAVVLALIAYVAYRELLHYERRAIEHVPVGAEFALRVDLEQVVMFDPLRRHLLPLVDQVPLGDPGGAPLPSRLVRLREAGINLGMQLREAVFAREPGGGWSLALGGLFDDEPLLPRIEAVLRAEPGVDLRAAGATLILEPSGLALGQAADGVLLICSDASQLERALQPTGGSEALGLRRDGAAAIGALASWFERLSRAGSGPAAAAGSLVRASIRLELGDPLELQADVEHAAPVELSTVRRQLDGWLGTPSDVLHFAPQADWGGERAVSARAQLTQTSPTHVAVTASWERAELDRAARSLAAWLEARFPGAGPAPR